MAYIVKSVGLSAAGAPVSPLVRAPFDRQRDVLKLARMGNADCKRMWNSFAEDAPGLARLVVADVERERQEDAAATDKVDKRLRQAERLVTKGRRPKRPKVDKAAQALYDNPAAYRAWVVKQRRRADEDSVTAWFRQSSDPLTRLPAETALGSHG